MIEISTIWGFRKYTSICSMILPIQMLIFGANQQNVKASLFVWTLNLILNVLFEKNSEKWNGHFFFVHVRCCKNHKSFSHNKIAFTVPSCTLSLFFFLIGAYLEGAVFLAISLQAILMPFVIFAIIHYLKIKISYFGR